jgi:tetratricopeptide (TPR) repeat protein
MIDKYIKNKLYAYLKKHNDINNIINGLALNEGHSFDIVLCSNKYISKMFFNYIKNNFNKKNSIYIDIPPQSTEAIHYIKNILYKYKEKDNTNNIFIFDFSSLNTEIVDIQWLFSKLNLIRNSFINILKAPFIFILPISTKNNFILMAPDFYSIHKDIALLDIKTTSTALIDDINIKEKISHIETSPNLNKLIEIKNTLKDKAFNTDEEELDILKEQITNHINIGNHLITDATKEYKISLKLSEYIQNKQPDNIEAKRYLSIKLEKISDIYLQKGEADNALKGYKRELKLMEDIQNKQPDNIEAKRDLSVNLEKISDIYLQKGEADNALKGYKRELKLMEDVQNKQPDNIEAKRNLSINLNKISDIYLQKGETNNALKGYERGLKLMEDIQNKQPDNIEVKRCLSISLNKISDIYLQKGEVDNALEGYEKGLKLMEDVQNKQPDNIEAKIDLSINLNKISDIYLQKGETNNALKGYKRGLKIREDIQNKQPNNIEAKRDLSISLNKISDIYLQKGEADNALKGYKRGLKIREDIQSKQLNNIEAKRDLSISYYNIALAYKIKNNFKWSMEFFIKAKKNILHLKKYKYGDFSNMVSIFNKEIDKLKTKIDKL